MRPRRNWAPVYWASAALGLALVRVGLGRQEPPVVLHVEPGNVARSVHSGPHQWTDRLPWAGCPTRRWRATQCHVPYSGRVVMLLTQRAGAFPLAGHSGAPFGKPRGKTQPPSSNRRTAVLHHLMTRARHTRPSPRRGRASARARALTLRGLPGGTYAALTSRACTDPAHHLVVMS